MFRFHFHQHHISYQGVPVADSWTYRQECIPARCKKWCVINPRPLIWFVSSVSFHCGHFFRNSARLRQAFKLFLNRDDSPNIYSKLPHNLANETLPHCCHPFLLLPDLKAALFLILEFLCCKSDIFFFNTTN